MRHGADAHLHQIALVAERLMLVKDFSAKVERIKAC